MTAELEQIGISLAEKKAIREDILDFEELISKQEGAFFGDTVNCPLTHHFADDIYVREIRIPAGTLLTGKIHRHSHPNFLMEGKVEVITESGGHEILKAPMFMISPPGTKRALYARSDLRWITIHSNVSNTQDLKKIEDFVIAKDYDEYEKFKNKKLPFYKRFLKLFQ